MLGAPASQTPLAGAPRARLLLVEDDPDIRETLSEALAWEGFEVECAAHGLDALERLARGGRVDAILLDLMMPVMNGWDFRNAQLADPALAGIPVVVLSASSPGDADPDGYLPKPFSIEALVQLVNGLVGRGTLAA